MFITYCIIAVLYAPMLAFSALAKVQHHPDAVRIIHDVVGVPLAWFPVLAACEFAGALGLLAGIRWRRLGMAAAIGVIVHFVGAIISHVRVGDSDGAFTPVPLLVIALAALVTRTKAPGPRAS